jgi:hypothetical protein
MFIPKGLLLGIFVLALSPICFVTIHPNDAWTAPAPLPRRGDGSTRTYRFTAQVEKNGGVTPFNVDKVITGTFTYDRKGKDKFPGHLRWAHYESARNAFSFQLGELRFTGTGDVLVTIGTFDHAEDFGIVAPDLRLPKGWEMDHTRRSQSYGVLLQNAPSKKAIAGLGVPDRLSLASFESTRELRLDFFHGVRFPGGRVNGRATVYGAVKSLKESHR